MFHYQYTELPTQLPKPNLTSPASSLSKIPSERFLQTELGSSIPSRRWTVSNYVRNWPHLAIWDFGQVLDLFSVCIKHFEKPWSAFNWAPRSTNTLSSWGQFWPEDHQPQHPHKVPRDISSKRRQLTSSLPDQHGGWLGLQLACPPKSPLPQRCLLGEGHSQAKQQGGDWPIATSFSCGMGLPEQCQGLLEWWLTFKEGK